MSARRPIHRALSILVYFTAITLGVGVLVINPVRRLLVAPVLIGVAALGHAVKTAHLDELGYATMWLWLAVLALAVGGMAVEEFVLPRNVPPVVEIPVARVLGTLGLVTVLAATYVRGVRRARRSGGRRTSAD